jgi:Na+/H+ antiporter NhaD/arsenite permease-like protein
MTLFVLVVFALTYLGMALGRVPGLKVERSSMAVVAAMALVAVGAMPPDRAVAAVDGGTLAVLLGLMVLSAQFGQAGLYDWAAARIAGARGSPRRLLALTILVAGGLSAILANDVVVFAMAPVLCLGARARGLDPRPFLAGLAGAANAGSAATIIGNPQNILIGAYGHLDFWAFAATCAPPAIAALGCTYAAVAWVWRAELAATPVAATGAPPPLLVGGVVKGGIAAALLVLLFTAGVDRGLAALAVGAALLVSRRHHSRALLAQVDWPLILLFAGLFVVNGALADTGLPRRLVEALNEAGVALDAPEVLVPFAVVASNTIGNVPAVMLLLVQGTLFSAGTLQALALVATLAGNLLLVGSLANLIVAERAAGVGVRFTVLDHVRAGVPMTLASLVVALLWLAARGALS